MNPNNLIFHSKIDNEVKEWAFPILLEHLGDYEGEVFVKNLMFFANEILFIVKKDGNESIIKVPVNLD